MNNQKERLYKNITSQELVTQFHQTFNHPINIPISVELMKLRAKLIAEEWDELSVEIWNSAQQGSITPNLLKEIGDLRYVISGLCVALGIDEEECVRRVHESNMSKLGEDGKPIHREDGKVLKGPNYFEPDLRDLVPGQPRCKECIPVELPCQGWCMT